MDSNENKKTEIELKHKDKNSKSTGKKPKKSKKKTIIILSVVAVILAIVLLVFGFVFKKLMLIEFDDPDDTTINTNQFVEQEGENLKPHEISDAKGSDMKSILKSWATNKGEKLSNKNVLNILLIGSDASSTESGRAHISDKGNTDVMMLVSIDQKNKKIRLSSFMRDSYTYLDGFDRWAKLNAACANGGPAYLVETIENNYKIEINGYVLVDFDSFKEVIDVVGGVSVDVPEHVAKFIGIPSGKNVLLNGEQALKFSRVRYSDANGDISRTARQRQVINSLINKCKGASISQINQVSNVILANVRTNISRKSILSYAAQAVTEGWAGYEIIEQTYPIPEGRRGYSGSAWIWIVDYPLCAQTLQKELYGETNIVLKDDRKTAITAMGKTPEKSK